MAGAVFPREWLARHINQKEMYALYHLLLRFCQHHPAVLRRAQVLISVDNEAVVGAFNRGRAKNRAAHDLLIEPFNLQVDYDFLLSLTWIPTAANGVADAISRPSRDTITRLAPAEFRSLWETLGPFNIDLIACNASVQASPATGAPLLFFARYHCAGTARTDMLAQDVAVLPGTGGEAFGFCFPPPLMVGHVVQHLRECHVHAVVLVPDIQAYWFPVLHQATTLSDAVGRGCPPRGGRHFSLRPCPKIGSLRDWRYPSWVMRALEVDFRPH